MTLCWKKHLFTAILARKWKEESTLPSCSLAQDMISFPATKMTATFSLARMNHPNDILGPIVVAALVTRPPQVPLACGAHLRAVEPSSLLWHLSRQDLSSLCNKNRVRRAPFLCPKCSRMTHRAGSTLALVASTTAKPTPESLPARVRATSCNHPALLSLLVRHSKCQVRPYLPRTVTIPCRMPGRLVRPPRLVWVSIACTPRLLAAICRRWSAWRTFAAGPLWAPSSTTPFLSRDWALGKSRLTRREGEEKHNNNERKKGEMYFYLGFFFFFKM